MDGLLSHRTAVWRNPEPPNYRGRLRMSFCQRNLFAGHPHVPLEQ